MPPQSEQNSPPALAAAPDDAQARAAQHRASRLLFSFGTGGLTLAAIYYAYTANVEDPFHLQVGILILCLAVLPCLLWAKRGGVQLPLFEVLMLTTANAYAIPLLAGHDQLAQLPVEKISEAGVAVVLYQVAAMCTYYSLRGRPITSPMFTREVISHDINRYIGYGLTITTIYTIITVFYDIIPSDIVGVTRAVFYGIGLVSVFVQARRWGLRDLGPTERSLFLFNMVVQVIIQFSTLFLVGGISIILLALVGYVSGSRKIPVLAIVVIGSITALLHNGKAPMRVIYWESATTRIQPKVFDLPGFFFDWVQYGLSVENSGPDDKKMANKLLDRTSLFHLLCIVVSRTPEFQPHLNGETYAQIPAQFVPRFFWPDKPSAHKGSNTLAIYYGMQGQDDVAKTTVGFGTITEAYANYGFFGIGLLGALYGAVYRKIQLSTAKSPLLSYPGLLTIILMAWSFQIEYTLSMWLSSMFQAIVAVIGIPFILRNFLG